ncbi:MAG: Fic family protein [Flavobacteriales bacterium]
MSGASTGQISQEVKKLIEVMEGEMKRAEIMKKLGLTHRENFIKNYLEPALNMG